MILFKVELLDIHHSYCEVESADKEGSGWVVKRENLNLNLNLNLFLFYNGYKLGRTHLFIWPLILAES